MIGRDHSRLSRSWLFPAWGGSGHFLDSAEEERGMVATTADFTVCPSGSLHIALQFAHCPRHPDRGVNGGCSAHQAVHPGVCSQAGVRPLTSKYHQSLLVFTKSYAHRVVNSQKKCLFLICTKIPVVVIPQISPQERTSCPGVRSTVSWLPPTVSSSKVFLSFLGEFMFLSTRPKANH